MEYTYEMFLAYLYLFLFLGGEFIFDWLELVELFRLFFLLALATLFFVGLYMLGGVYFCGSCFKLLIDL